MDTGPLTCSLTGPLVRPLRIDDVELICRHREQMFLEAGRPIALLETMTAHFRPWVTEQLRNGGYFGFIVESQGAPIAGIGLMTIDWPPHPSHPTQDRRGYVLNVYVEKTRRRQGLGRLLMDLAEKEFESRQIQFAILHSTAAGKPMYANLGWNPTTEMSKTFWS